MKGNLTRSPRFCCSHCCLFFQEVSHRWTECIHDECSHYHGCFQHHLGRYAALTAADDFISGCYSVGIGLEDNFDVVDCCLLGWRSELRL